MKLDAYNAYVEALRASGSSSTPAAPQLFPLQLLRGSVEYLEILGALFAIVMGCAVVAKEKQRATLQLIFSRPSGRHSLAAGNLVALATTWLLSVVVIVSAVTTAVAVTGHAPFTTADCQRLVVAAAASWGYLMLWSTVAMGLASTTRRLNTALIVALVLWLVVVLIVPQIGDTMDPDDQVPGGLFTRFRTACATWAGSALTRAGSISVSTVNGVCAKSPDLGERDVVDVDLNPPRGGVASIGTRERQQVADQPGQTGDLVIEHLPGDGRKRRAKARGHVKCGAHRGQRAAQLMAGVGDELLLTRHGALEAREHAIR